VDNRTENRRKTMAALIDLCRSRAINAYHSESRLSKEAATKGDDALSLRWLGVRAAQLGERLGISRSAAIRRLHVLERDGLVTSEPHAGGWTFWWPAGLAGDLKAELNSQQAGKKVSA